MSTISSMVRVTRWTSPREDQPEGGDVDPLGLEQGRVALGLQLGPAGGQLGLEVVLAWLTRRPRWRRAASSRPPRGRRTSPRAERLAR